jgi:asparagine synthase (glutamine-hydrolysing)
MCGVAGGFAFDPDADPISRDVIMRLNDLQRRRGPDGCGLWSSEDDRLVLGHRRLAIIDTGDTGAQPMSDVTGRWVISFNGELYNYRALRQELEHLGRVFRTKSDTEVLMNAVAVWGEAALPRLRGMYAFALWDTRDRELWLVRDPYGIKPLYVATNRGTIWFASQARPLAQCAPVDKRRDAAALTGFYLWGHVPEPFSWWAGIRMLPAGHLLRLRAGRTLANSVAFARVQESYTRRVAKPLAPDEMRGLMLDSVRHHLVSDVPVGVFLSAGIDSIVVAALAAELGTQLRTVTLAFEEYAGTPDDEAPLAEAAAKLLGSEHVTVRIGRRDFEMLVDDFLRCMDQPTIDGLNTYLVSRVAARQGLKVALSGLGGDELFGGYPSFRQIPMLLKWGQRRIIPKSLGRAIQTLMRALPISGIPPKAAALLSGGHDVASAYLLRRSLHLEGELDSLLDETWVSRGLERLATCKSLNDSIDNLIAAGCSTHGQVAALESCWYMRNQLLRDADWASMAHGLEVRMPFVDVQVIDHLGPAIASPSPPDKLDLARCARLLPQAVLKRRKTGFTTPVRGWISEQQAPQPRGLRNWATQVHRSFRSAGPCVHPSVAVG